MVKARVVSSRIFGSNSSRQHGSPEAEDPGRQQHIVRRNFNTQDTPHGSVAASCGSLLVRRSHSPYALQPLRQQATQITDERSAEMLRRNAYRAPSAPTSQPLLEALLQVPTSPVMRSASAHVIGSNRTPDAAFATGGLPQWPHTRGTNVVTPMSFLRRVDRVSNDSSNTGGTVSSSGNVFRPPEAASPALQPEKAVAEEVPAATSRLRSASTSSRRTRVSFDNDTKKPLPTSLASLVRTPEPMSDASPKANRVRPGTPRASSQSSRRALHELDKVFMEREEEEEGQ